MAVLYSNTDGTLVAFAASASEERTRLPNPPASAANTLRFDESTNAELVAGLATNWNAYRLVGNVLTQNGNVVTISAPGADFNTQRNLAALLTALRAGTLTNVQQQSVIAFLVAKLRSLGYF